MQNTGTICEYNPFHNGHKHQIEKAKELGAPFVLLILLIIVFLSSGIMDNIRAIFDMAGIAL